LGGNPCSDNRVIRKETEDQTRKRVEEDLEDSAAKYADHAEIILKLQQTYLKKYHPRQSPHSYDVSQRPEDVPNKRQSGRVPALFRGRQEDLQGPKPAKSKEGIANTTHGFQLDFLN
jgi:hypothetical protein